MRRRRRVDVGVGGKIVVAVPQPGLNVLQRVAQVQHDRGAAVPISYNKDKTRNPSKIKGFRACPYSFSKRITLRSRPKGGVEK